MIESIKPVGAVEYTSGAKSVRDATVAGQQEADEAYSVDLSASRGGKLSAEQIAAVKKQVEAENESLRELVEKLLSKQGITAKAAFGVIEFNPDMTPAEAEAAISENGEWGVNAVSDRIVAFAIAVSGNDTSKLAELKAAIEKGFKLAGQMLGGQLPDICSQTYNAVMEKMDKWAQSGGVDTQA
jgi:anti-sigma28 factor (negative regulator of flagellin synthesis)